MNCREFNEVQLESNTARRKSYQGKRDRINELFIETGLIVKIIIMPTIAATRDNCLIGIQHWPNLREHERLLRPH